MVLLLNEVKRVINDLNLKEQGMEILLVGEDGLPLFSTLLMDYDKIAAMCTVIAVSSERNMKELGKDFDYMIISSKQGGGIIISKLTSSYLVLTYPSNEKLGLALFLVKRIRAKLGDLF